MQGLQVHYNPVGPYDKPNMLILVDELKYLQMPFEHQRCEVEHASWSKPKPLLIARHRGPLNSYTYLDAPTGELRIMISPTVYHEIFKRDMWNFEFEDFSANIQKIKSKDRVTAAFLKYCYRRLREEELQRNVY